MVPVLRGPRVVLRPFTLDDAPAVYAYASDPEVARYVSWPVHLRIEDSLAFLAASAERVANGTCRDWCIDYRGQVAGSIGLFDHQPTHERAEVGYVLGRRFWRQGLGSEALRVVLDHAFCDLALRKVVAHVRPENAASRGLLGRAGFREEGLLRQHLFFKGEWWDVVSFGLLVGEFRPGRG